VHAFNSTEAPIWADLELALYAYRSDPSDRALAVGTLCSRGEVVRQSGERGILVRPLGRGQAVSGIARPLSAFAPTAIQASPSGSLA
jgi:hypothetical protein